MAESEVKTPFMVIELGSLGGQLVFDTYADVRAWLDKQRAEWNWLSGLQTNATNEAWQTVASLFQQRQESLQNAQNYHANGQPERERNALEATCNSIKSLFQEYTWLLPVSPQHAFIERIRSEKRLKVAGLIVAIWLRRNLDGAPIQQAIEAVLEWQFFERGIKDRTRSERASLSKLAAEYGEQLTQSQNFANELAQTFATLKADASAQQEAQQSLFNVDQNRRSEAWEQQLTDVESKLAHLTKTYDQYMALQSPVRYWESKRQRHRNWAALTAVITALAMSGVWLGLSEKLESVGNRFAALNVNATAAKAAPNAVSAVDLSASWHFDVALLVLAGTLSFWVLRLLVRVFLSHLHLENDAAERVTMARTYLALMRREKLPKDDDLKTVLTALFRPSGDGIVKDEGIPPSLLEFLTRAGK